MTTISVTVPPVQGRETIARIAEGTPLSPREARTLLHCVVKDTLLAVHESGGELVITVPPASHPGLSEADQADPNALAETLVDDTLPDDASPTFLNLGPEEMALSTHLERLQTMTTSASVGIVRPMTPLLERRHLDTAAMRLRRHAVVVGPTSGRGWYFIGVSDGESITPVGHEEHLTAVIGGATRDGRSVDLLSSLPSIEIPEGLSGVLAILESSELTGRQTGPYTRVGCADLGLHTDPSDMLGGIKRRTV